MSITLYSKETACETLARELCVQPELAAFFRNLDGSKPETAPAKYNYTGNKSQVDDETRLKIGALRLLGASDREIEKQLHIDHRSIPIQLEQLEKAGQLPALKERLTRLVGDNAERSSLLLRRLLEEGLNGECTLELAAMLKATGSVNCFQVEKFQLLTGGATEIVEQRVGAGREEIERWWREQASVPVQATVVPVVATVVPTPAGDVDSADSEPKGQQTAQNEPSGHVCDTSAGSERLDETRS